MATHVSPQYLRGKSRLAEPGALRLQMLQSPPSDSEDIWVTSFLPAELPEPEKKRKDVDLQVREGSSLKVGKAPMADRDVAAYLK
jgi:hypothetical protein